MIFSELRANAYKIAAIALGVLAVALLIGCLFLRNSVLRADIRADAESARAQALQTELQAVKDGMARDAVSSTFTDQARSAMDESAAKTNALLATLSDRLNDRPPVPAVCPSPDPILLRELAEGSSRFHSAERGLRSLRSAEDSGAK